MLLADTAFKAAPLQARSIFSLPGQLVWCGSMQRGQDGRSHLYFSFWPESAGHNGWVTHSKIGHAVSNDPLGPYEFEGIALDGSGVPGSWDRDAVHNPTVISHGGLLHLYYMGNWGDGSFWSHRNAQRIGYAYAERPEGPWHRSERPALDVGAPGSWDCLMTSNPTVCQMPGGRFIMIYKGVGCKGEAPAYGPVLHGVAFAESPEGPFVKEGGPIFQSAGAKFPGEDPFVFQHGGKLFVLLKDMGRNYSGSERGLVLFESADGLEWRPHDPALALTRSFMMEDGSRREFHRVERPQLVFDGGKPYLFCAAKPEERLDSSFNFSVALDVNL